MSHFGRPGSVCMKLLHACLESTPAHLSSQSLRSRARGCSRARRTGFRLPTDPVHHIATAAACLGVRKTATSASPYGQNEKYCRLASSLTVKTPLGIVVTHQYGPLAQLVEQRPFKAWVSGSNPERLKVKSLSGIDIACAVLNGLCQKLVTVATCDTGGAGPLEQVHGGFETLLAVPQKNRKKEGFTTCATGCPTEPGSRDGAPGKPLVQQLKPTRGKTCVPIGLCAKMCRCRTSPARIFSHGRTSGRQIGEQEEGACPNALVWKRRKS